MNDLDLWSCQPLRQRHIRQWISRFQRTTDRKWPMAIRMVTWSMNVTLKGQTRDPNTIKATAWLLVYLVVIDADRTFSTWPYAPVSFQYSSSWFLKALSDETLTTADGSLFHLFTRRMLKNFCLRVDGHLGLYLLCPPRPISLLESWENFLESILFLAVNVLNFSIKSPRNLLLESRKVDSGCFQSSFIWKVLQSCNRFGCSSSYSFQTGWCGNHTHTRATTLGKLFTPNVPLFTK